MRPCIDFTQNFIQKKVLPYRRNHPSPLIRSIDSDSVTYFDSNSLRKLKLKSAAHVKKGTT